MFEFEKTWLMLEGEKVKVFTLTPFSSTVKMPVPVLVPPTA